MNVKATDWSVFVLGVSVLAACVGVGERTLRPRPASPVFPHVVMVNGGGTPATNYQSHLLHLRELTRLLRSAGVDDRNIVAFSADGQDPAPDLLVSKGSRIAGQWLLSGTSLERRLSTDLSFVSSRISGLTLRPATREVLAAWFDETGAGMQPGSTLVIYVTDHGTRAAEEPRESSITLWGDGETLSVGDFSGLMKRIPPGVRVVTVMSQCFSGGFARLGFEPPIGSWCGYFSTTPDRVAYGCYPENRGRENVGYSFEFFRGIRDTGSFREAHRRALVRDRTPDVPHTTSDAFLMKLLQDAADEHGRPMDDFVDEWLEGGEWGTDVRWRDLESRITEISGSFGLSPVYSVQAWRVEEEKVRAARARADEYARTWRSAFTALTRQNLDRFLADRPAWRSRTEARVLEDLAATERAAVRRELLADLTAFSRANQGNRDRLWLLRERSSLTGRLRSQMEARLGALLRIRILLETVSGQRYVESADPAGHESYEALRACEDLELPPLLSPPHPTRTGETRTDPGDGDLTAFDDDLRELARSTPGWMGISYEPLGTGDRERLRLSSGAVRVGKVLAGSPAAAAGIEVGDIVLGPPDQRFDEPHQIREWIMLSTIGQPTSLELIRRGELWTTEIVPAPWPADF